MKFFKIIYYFFITFLGLITLFLIFSIFPFPGNFKVMTVLSGSMEPAIKTGSVVIVKPEKNYKIGDIITFYSEGRLPITHRIYDAKIIKGEVYYITKGDANKTPDDRKISKKGIIGKVLFSVPYLGFLIEFTKKPVGFLFLIIVPAMIIICEEIRNIITEMKRLKGKKGIILVILAVVFNWISISSVGQTLAYLNDNESSSKNVFGASSLDFRLHSPRDFFPPSPGKHNKLVRKIKLINQGNLKFKYQIKVKNYSGELCKNLQLSANLDGGKIECPRRNLTDFSCGPFEISGDTDNWKFVAYFSGKEILPQSCKFEIVFDAWQSNLSKFSGGFSDQEKIKSKITKHYSEIFPELNIVINEFLPNPVGRDDAKKPKGEWVELYNKGNFPIPLKGWFLMDFQGNKLPIPNSIIPPKGFLVVYLDGKYSPGWLNNRGEDGVALFAPKNSKIPSWRCVDGYCLIDAHGYQGRIPEGKSFARIPDGSKNWFDPTPTPGKPNQLSIKEKNLQSMKLNQKQLFQEFINQLSKKSTSPQKEKETSSKIASTNRAEKTSNHEMSTQKEKTKKEEIIQKQSSDKQNENNPNETNNNDQSKGQFKEVNDENKNVNLPRIIKENSSLECQNTEKDEESDIEKTDKKEELQKQN